MFAKKIFLTLLIVAMVSLIPTVGAIAQSTSKTKIEGTWLVTATFTDPAGIPPFKVLFTFMPGRTDAEGTIIDTNEFELTPGPICTPDQGVWQRVEPRKYIATQYNFCFDPGNGNAPAGLTKIRADITLGSSGNELTGRQYIEGYDTAGQVVFTGTVLLDGVRLKAEAPPQ